MQFSSLSANHLSFTHVLSLGRKIFLFTFGMFLCALGSSLSYRANLGLAPWDVLHEGISMHTPLTFGEASTVVAVAVVLIGLPLGIRPRIGTIANPFLGGFFIDRILNTNLLVGLSHQLLILRLLVTVLGIFSTGLGSAFYITSQLGVGPRDGLMFRLQQTTKWRLSLVRSIIEGIALISGILLGGTFGIGTIMFALGIGASLECCLWLVRSSQSWLTSQKKHYASTPMLAHKPTFLKQPVVPESCQ